MASLWAAITWKQRLGHSNQLYFLNPEWVRIPWLVVRKMFQRKIFLYGAFYPKNHFFANFCAHTLKQCSGLVCAQFWCHRPSTQLVRSVIPQSFQGHPRSWPVVNVLESRSFQSQVTPILVHKNSRFRGVFFAQNRFSLPNRQLLPFHTLHILKATVWSFGTGIK